MQTDCRHKENPYLTIVCKASTISAFCTYLIETVQLDNIPHQAVQYMSDARPSAQKVWIFFLHCFPVGPVYIWVISADTIDHGCSSKLL